MIDFNGKRNIFSNTKKRSNPVRIFLLMILIMAGLFVIRGLKTGAINPMLQTTVTPTRSLNSFAQEGQTHFQAGNLEKAIEFQDNLVKGDKFPDPTTDSSFKKYVNDEKFKALVKKIKIRK